MRTGTRETQAARCSRWATASVAALSILLLASGVFSVRFFYTQSAEQFITLQQDRADFAAHRIEQFFADLQRQMVWTMLPYAPQNGISVEQRRHELHKLLMQAPAVDEIAWLDDGGRVQIRASRLAADGVGEDTDHSESPEFIEATALGLFRSPVYFRDDVQPRLLLWLGTPDRHTGILAAEVNLAFVWDLVAELSGGHGGLAYVVDHRGTLVAHPEMRLGLRAAEASGWPTTAASLPPERFRLVSQRLRVARDHSNNEVLIASAGIPSMDWTVFVEFPLEDMLRPLYFTALHTGALLAAALALAMITGLLLTRRMVRPLRALEAGAAHLGAELESLSRLKRFFSPQVAEEILSSGAADGPLRSHRSEITAAFIDLRGYTALTESGNPDEVMRLVREYHAAMGRIIMEFQGTLERFAGDGMLVFFNDPLPVPDHALRAVRMAKAMVAEFRRLGLEWKARGHDLQIGIGIAQGPAMLGPIGFEGRLDYGAVGSVCSLAARLSDEAHGGQILVCERVCWSTRHAVPARFVGNLALRGFSRRVPIFELV
jgi:adenylate cyclase